MLIERPYVTSYLLAIAMFALSLTICEILNSQNVHDLDLYNRPRSNAYMQIEMTQATFWVGNRMFVLSVTICEITTYEHPSVLDLNLILQMKVYEIEYLEESWQVNVTC